MSKTITKKEEIIYGQVYQVVCKYIDVEKFTKINDLVIDITAILVPVFDDMEKKLIEKARHEVKKAESANKKDPPKSSGLDHTINAIKMLWDINKRSTLSSHIVETNYKESVTKHAASHSDEWSKAMAWLENKDDVLKSNMVEFELGFSKWVATNFHQPEIMFTLLDLLKDSRK